MTLQGVILDIDGTLVLSNDAHAQAWVEAFKKFGHQIEFEQVRPMIGMGGDQIIPKLVPGLSSEEGEGKKIASSRKELFLDKYASNLAPANGARKLLLKMQEQGLRLVVATSAKSEELSVLLKIAEIDDLLEETATSSDADSSKPDPDIIKAALHKSQLQPDQVVMLGDTPYDIQSANAAGVDVIAFRCGGFDDAQLAKAIAIYDTPADLLAQYDNSPLSTGSSSLV
ncbi:HAD family hydrolase [Chlorogloeopsis sp. ULAP02]|uniref:HAD family hydrolase n=1 Tax=Chlorogloeopsis sp. ULAP02 TaxID=3107926 RepID=UPI003135E595